MPVLSFTQADVLATKIIESGKYPAIVCKIEQKASKEKTSTHFFVDFRIIDGPYKGKELSIVANTKTKDPSYLTGFGYMVPTAVFMQIDAAIKRKPVAEGNVDTDELLNQPLDIMVTADAFDGVLVNLVKSFKPYQSDDQVAF